LACTTGLLFSLSLIYLLYQWFSLCLIYGLSPV
jgi:hypothetical protein